jgi:hypothetical protein
MRVFLGGTCAETSWRNDIIGGITIDYFNPVVEDWTKDDIAIEDDEKNNKCDIHLYVITSEMFGVYSIAEMIDSVHNKEKQTIVQILPNDFDDAQLKSLEATSKLINERGGICNIDDDLNISIDIINSLDIVQESVSSNVDLLNQIELELVYMTEYVKTVTTKEEILKAYNEVFRMDCSDFYDNTTSQEAKKLLKDYTGTAHTLETLLDKSTISKYDLLLGYLRGIVNEEMISMGSMPNAVAADITYNKEEHKVETRQRPLGGLKEEGKLEDIKLAVKDMNKKSPKDGAILSAALYSKESDSLDKERLALYFDMLDEAGFQILKQIASLKV